ncbi:hypothetical protein F1715_11675, partial [Streptococcus pneumoniae]
MLLVESAQSMANWLEKALFKAMGRDSVSDELVPEVRGISFIELRPMTVRTERACCWSNLRKAWPTGWRKHCSRQ